MPGEEKVDKYDLSKDPAWIDFQKTFKGVLTIMQQQGAAINGFRTELAATKLPVNGNKKDDTGSGDDEPDVDSMSQGEFLKFVVGKVGGMLDEKLTGVNKKVDDTVRSLSTNDLRKQVMEFKKDHKDFDDWTDEMTLLAKENPTLSIPRLYQLVRSENADKVKELDAKYVDKKDDKDVSDKGLSLFGGFKPSTKTGEGGEDKAQKLTVDQAADKAWEEAVAATPALAKFSEDVLD